MRNGTTITRGFGPMADARASRLSLQGLAASVAREWECADWVGMVILLTPFFIALSGVVAALLGKGFYKWYTDEDSFLENLQVVFYSGALVLSMMMVRRLWRAGETGIAALYALVSVGLFFLIGEEISWGQRIFGWTTPGALREANRQEEINLHNLTTFGDMFKWVQLLVGAYGALLPLVVLRANWLGKYRHQLSYLVPPYSVGLYFAFMFIWKAFRRFLPEPLNNHFFLVNSYNEVIEMILAVGFFLFMLYQWRRLRAKERTATAGPDAA